MRVSVNIWGPMKHRQPARGRALLATHARDAATAHREVIWYCDGRVRDDFEKHCIVARGGFDKAGGLPLSAPVHRFHRARTSFSIGSGSFTMILALPMAPAGWFGQDVPRYL